MLPLRSQPGLPFGGMGYQDPYAHLQSNRIMLCKREYPLNSESIPGSNKTVDRKLLGGLILIEDISLKEISLSRSVRILSSEDKLNFLETLRGKIHVAIVPENAQPPRSSTGVTGGGSHNCYFGNACIANFRTHLASIPAWSDCDLADTFLSTYSFEDDSKVDFRKGSRSSKSKPSIIMSKRRLESLLTMSYPDGRGKQECSSENIKQERRKQPVLRDRKRDWGLFSLSEEDSKSTSDRPRQETDSDIHQGHSNKKRCFSDERIPTILQPINESKYVLFEEADRTVVRGSSRASVCVWNTYGDSTYGCWTKSAESTGHITSKLFESIPSDANCFVDHIIGQVDALMDFKCVHIDDCEKSRIKYLMDLESRTSRGSKISREGVTIEVSNIARHEVDNPWNSALQLSMGDHRERAKFEEFDEIYPESLGDSWSVGQKGFRGRHGDFYRSQLMFCSSFFDDDDCLRRLGNRCAATQEEEKMTENAGSQVELYRIIPDAIHAYNPKFHIKTLSVADRCKNFPVMDTKYVNNHDDTRHTKSSREGERERGKVERREPAITRGVVLDRLLSSRHALRCIPIASPQDIKYPHERYSESYTESDQREWRVGCDSQTVGRYVIDLVLHSCRNRTIQPVADQEKEDKFNVGRLKFERKISRRKSVVGNHGIWLKNLKDVYTHSALQFSKETVVTDGNMLDSEIRSDNDAYREKKKKSSSMSNFLKLALLPSVPSEILVTSLITREFAADHINNGKNEIKIVDPQQFPDKRKRESSKYESENRYVQQALIRVDKENVPRAIKANSINSINKGEEETAADDDREMMEGREECDREGDRDGNADANVVDGDEYGYSEHEDLADKEEPRNKTDTPGVCQPFPFPLPPIRSFPVPAETPTSLSTPSTAAVAATLHTEIDTYLPSTLDLDQMVASYLVMHGKPNIATQNNSIAEVASKQISPASLIGGDSEIGVGTAEGSREGSLTTTDSTGCAVSGRVGENIETHSTVIRAEGVEMAGQQSLRAGISRKPHEPLAVIPDIPADVVGNQSAVVRTISAATGTSVVTPDKGEGTGMGVVGQGGGQMGGSPGVPANRLRISASRFEGLCVLVSESFMELPEGSVAINVLADIYGISCIDVPVEPPVTVIVDSCTGVCVVDEDVLCNREELKVFVKMLTRLVYKFTCIWIIIVSRYNEKGVWTGTGEGMTNLYTAISRFPIDIIVRGVAGPRSNDLIGTVDLSIGERLASMIHIICNDTANAVCLSRDLLREHFVSREFLISLLTGDSRIFTGHCQFLETFPSINFYSAAQILSSMTLQQIAQHLPDKINVLKEALTFVPPISDVCFDSFFTLCTLHCGVQGDLSNKIIMSDETMRVQLDVEVDVEDRGKILNSPLIRNYPTHSMSPNKYNNSYMVDGSGEDEYGHENNLHDLDNHQSEEHSEHSPGDFHFENFSQEGRHERPPSRGSDHHTISGYRGIVEERGHHSYSTSNAASNRCNTSSLRQRSSVSPISESQQYQHHQLQQQKEQYQRFQEERHRMDGGEGDTYDQQQQYQQNNQLYHRNTNTSSRSMRSHRPRGRSPVDLDATSDYAHPYNVSDQTQEGNFFTPNHTPLRPYETVKRSRNQEEYGQTDIGPRQNYHRQRNYGYYEENQVSPIHVNQPSQRNNRSDYNATTEPGLQILRQQQRNNASAAAGRILDPRRTNNADRN